MINYRQLEETLIYLLARVTTCSQIQPIQAQILTLGLHQSPYLAPKLAAAFFRFRKIAVARRWFGQILRPNAVLWNVMFKGYTEAGLYNDTLLLFNEMMRMRRRKDNDGFGFFVVKPNAYTFTFVIKSAAFLSRLRDGEQVHCFTVKTGWFWCNSFVGTTLVDLYASRVDDARKVFEDMPVKDVVSGTAMDDARKVFEDMPVKDVVSGTAMVRAYVSAGDLECARRVFDRMADRDVVLWNTMISGYAKRGDVVAARGLFTQMPHRDKDSMAWNTVLLGYAGADGSLVEECERFFKEMPAEKKNIFSWNVLIGVYSRHGRLASVLSTFKQMFFHASCSRAVVPNDATLAVVLSACSKLGALGWGRGIHSYVTKRHHGLLTSSCIGNGLIDMYAKCGCIEDAVSVFRSMEGTRDVITWNSTIGGLAAHGRAMEALEMFERMKDEGNCIPDGITFVGVLSACVHSVGFVERGLTYFRSMVEEYMIGPWIEHYGCMVALLVRAGLVGKALGFVKRMSMSMEPDCVIWSTLLGACQQQLDEHGHEHDHQRQMLIIAELAMSRLVRLEPEDVTHYVMLSKVYGACRRWADVARLKQVVNRMCSLQNKRPGRSWVRVNSHSQLVEFCSSDTWHSRTKEIYETLQGLTDMSIPAALPKFAAHS